MRFVTPNVAFAHLDIADKFGLCLHSPYEYTEGRLQECEKAADYQIAITNMMRESCIILKKTLSSLEFKPGVPWKKIV